MNKTNSFDLQEWERIIVHEETVFLEFSKKTGEDKFHPKPSNTINKDRKLYVLQVYKVISIDNTFYEGILYDFRKLFAARIEKEGKETIYHDNMEIISTDYMDEFGVQNAIFLGQNKMEVIKKVQEFVREDRKNITAK